MIIQLDIAKAYDKVNWGYIKKILTAFGFDHNWVRWLMALVTTSSFSIFVNSSPSVIFFPSRGLRQGDLLSPFLFILMMEGLDDTILQGIPIVKEATAYKKILNAFAKASGMEVNLTKSKIFFFNTNIAIQRNISRIIGFQRDSLPSKYLGVALTDRPMLKNIWELVLLNLQDKVKKWTFKALNMAGRLVLRKAVLQSISVFMLSALPAAKGVLEQIRNIQRDFLWGKEETRKKWALVSWEKICKPKRHGGLGLVDQEILNKVVRAKFWWRWVQETRALWARVWKEKYASSWHTNDLIRMS
eukprot:PITA_04111